MALSSRRSGFSKGAQAHDSETAIGWRGRQNGAANQPQQCAHRPTFVSLVRRLPVPKLSRLIQHPNCLALQLHVRASGAGHVFRDHERRHRSFRRRGCGFGQRRIRAAQPVWIVGGIVWRLAAGAVIGLLNGLAITRLKIPPFISSLAAMLAAQGLALLLANNQSVSVSYETAFTAVGQGDWLGFPVPAWIAAIAYLVGSICLNVTATGRYVLAIGGNEEAARLMGLPVDRVKLWLYLLSGLMAGLAGVILAAQFGAGQPTEGVGWELFAIASVVVGGTLLTGGQGSVGATLAGVFLLGLIFNILNFENGLGWISLSAYRQSVIRGLFLMVVVIFQSRLVARQTVTR